jgi:alpha-glucosidase
MFRFVFLLAVLAVAGGKPLALTAQSHTLTSPDGSLRIEVFTQGQLRWSVYFQDRPVATDNALTLQLADGTVLGARARVVRQNSTEVDEILTPVVPVKSSQIRDHYRQLRLDFAGDFAVEFRAYDHGAAYRFVTDRPGEVTVTTETVELNLPAGTTSHFPAEASLVSHYERHYIPTQVDTLDADDFASLPVLFTTPAQIRVLFTEADLYDYPGLFLQGAEGSRLTGRFPPHVRSAQAAPNGPDRNQVLTYDDFIARTSGRRAFPWRVLVVTDDDRDLLTTQLVYQLSRPLQLAETDWIEPGMVAWDWYNANNLFGVDFPSGIDNRTYRYYIDFAAAYGLDYIILDEGWSRTTTDILHPNPAIDVPALVEYGRDKGVGIVLWTLWKPIDDNMEAVFDLYQKWGVKGVKIDFMQRTDQDMVNFYERTVREAARRKLLIDFHGAYKPAGLRRAYPNMISYEGVKGAENNKWSVDVTPEHNVTLPFIRMAAGPMDYTPGAMRNAQPVNHLISFDRPMSLGTRAHQAAMYVVFESPLQMFCDTPTAYEREPAYTRYLAQMPTVWDETVPLAAVVDDYVLLARRRGSTWYVGAMTDGEARELELDCSFLPPGRYEAEILQDGPNAGRMAEDYQLRREKITPATKLRVPLAPGGGWTAIIRLR